MNKGFEQLRVAVAYPNVNVKMVGTHSGISIGEDGPSQMSIEETSLACSLPGFVVLAPADEVAARGAGPRRGGARRPGVHPHRPPKAPGDLPRGQRFEIGKAIELIAGTDVTLIANGLMVAEAIRAQEQLEAEGISARVIDMHTVKPLDRDAIERAAVQTGAIVVAEEHLVDGGLGVRVAQVVSRDSAPAPWSSSASPATPNPARRTACWTSTGCAR